MNIIEKPVIDGQPLPKKLGAIIPLSNGQKVLVEATILLQEDPTVQLMIDYLYTVDKKLDALLMHFNLEVEK